MSDKDQDKKELEVENLEVKELEDEDLEDAAGGQQLVDFSCPTNNQGCR